MGDHYGERFFGNMVHEKRASVTLDILITTNLPCVQ